METHDNRELKQTNAAAVTFKFTTMTNGTAAGKFDIVFGRSEKHSCC